MNLEEFLKPRLVGGRFEGHAIPLEFLRDLAVLNDIIQECARTEFLKVNPGRRRLPRGFADEYTLLLSKVEEGSVIPVITLLTALAGTPASHQFYVKARESFIQGLSAVSRNESPEPFLSSKARSLFKNFGERLRDGEAIDFPTSTPGGSVRYTKETRRTLLLSLPGTEEVTEEIEFRGLVEITDQGEKKFVIKLPDGSEISGPMAEEHYDNILVASNRYRDGAKLFVQGVGTRDRQGKLIRLDTIDHSDVLDPFDVHARFDELRLMKEGWLDNVGSVPKPEELDWAETSIAQIILEDIPRPRIYLAPEGTILLEWSTDSYAASFEVNVSEKSGYWHVLDTKSGADSDEEVSLIDQSGWDKLVEHLKNVGSSAESVGV